MGNGCPVCVFGTKLSEERKTNTRGVSIVLSCSILVGAVPSWAPGPPVGGQKFLCLAASRRDFPLWHSKGSRQSFLGADGGGGGGGGGGDDAARAVLAEERMSARKYGIPKGQAEFLGTVRDRKPGNKVSKTTFQVALGERTARVSRAPPDVTRARAWSSAGRQGDENTIHQITIFRMICREAMISLNPTFLTGLVPQNPTFHHHW